MSLRKNENEAVRLVEWMCSSWRQFCCSTRGLKGPTIKAQRFRRCITLKYASRKFAFGGWELRREVFSSTWGYLENADMETYR